MKKIIIIAIILVSFGCTSKQTSAPAITNVPGEANSIKEFTQKEPEVDGPGIIYQELDDGLLLIIEE